ncbi:hypothetical protein L218DRAFT_872841, partial [Marasmius fiardii PR-910]
YVTVFNATLLVYDVIISLQAEIEYIWMSSWSFVTFLYILQRYLPFFDITYVTLHHHFGADLSSRLCTLDHKMAAWSAIVGFVLSEIILTVRVWAVWERRFVVAIGLVIFLFACWVPAFIFIAQFLNAMRFTIPPLPNLRGCFIAGGSSVFYLCWVCLMVYDTGIFLLMLIPGVSAYRRGGRSELVKTIYRDGKIRYGSSSRSPAH